ncbi:hypothetical protein AVEN_73822-1 [Araneus ventricosus]|uniref:Uncharacterized protein n=1 Tax=Araneus ventricosus TaxID=182803 RepID=A0A4Y2SM91_ARAVE|nr:hypothetical protein AVEN_73822-1 [Araneus ventricosus]
MFSSLQKPQYDEAVIGKAGAYSTSKAAVNVSEFVKADENKKLKIQSDSISNEEILDSEEDYSVNMLFDDAIRVAVKHPSPTTTPEKNSKSASLEKVPCSKAAPEPRKPNVPKIEIDDKLNTTALVKTL